MVVLIVSQLNANSSLPESPLELLRLRQDPQGSIRLSASLDLVIAEPHSGCYRDIESPAWAFLFFPQMPLPFVHSGLQTGSVSGSDREALEVSLNRLEWTHQCVAGEFIATQLLLMDWFSQRIGEPGLGFPSLMRSFSSRFKSVPDRRPGFTNRCSVFLVFWTSRWVTGLVGRPLVGISFQASGRDSFRVFSLVCVVPLPLIR
ncbi:hypothetical protein U1Q18_016829 [Sarracenia purpurea var. burkii]